MISVSLQKDVLTTSKQTQSSNKLCNNHNLRITNGQIPGNRIQNFTCFDNSGASRVDYVLPKSPLYKNKAQFKALPLEFDSKHAPNNTIYKTSGLKIEKEQLSNPPKVYKWDNQGIALCSSFANNEVSKYHINALCNKLKDSNLTSYIQKTTKFFVNFWMKKKLTKSW